jgi:hypothetical protein
MRRALILLLPLVAAAPACRPPVPLPLHRARPPVEQVLLERQNQGIESLITAARAGKLIPFEQVLVVVQQAFVQSLIEATLPYEQVLADRYRVRAEKAKVEFEDGFALVQLSGRASLLQDPDTAAEIDVYGGIDIVELDAQTGILHGRVKVLAVETQRVNLVGIRAPVRRLVDDLSREQLSAFEPLLSNIEIPVRLVQTVEIPAVNQAGIRIERELVPVEGSVIDVKAFRGKLWVGITAKTGQKEAAAR